MRSIQAGGWHRHGAKSCAAWLSWRIGLSIGPAREHVRVANKLGELPAIDAAMAAGELSYSKARAITRVANDDNVELLLSLARDMTAAQLERTCRLHRQMGPQDVEEEERRERNRYLRRRYTEDGMVSIELRLRPDEAARVMKAIEAAAESEPLIDGAVALAEATLRGDKVSRSPVDVTVHVDASDLSGHTDDGTGIPAETTRRLCCDAGLTPVIEDADGKPLDVGRKTRTVPAAIRRALDLRDGGCQFPGCTHGLWTRITSSTGPTGATQRYPTWCSCARIITSTCTSSVSACGYKRTAALRSIGPTVAPSSQSAIGCATRSHRRCPRDRSHQSPGATAAGQTTTGSRR